MNNVGIVKNNSNPKLKTYAETETEKGRFWLQGVDQDTIDKAWSSQKCWNDDEDDLCMCSISCWINNIKVQSS